MQKSQWGAVRGRSMDMPTAVHGGRVVQRYRRMRVLETLGCTAGSKPRYPLSRTTVDSGPHTVILHSCDILSWAPVPSNECRSTGLYGAIKADLEQRSSSSTRKTGATCTQLWIEWLPQRVPSNGERLYHARTSFRLLIAGEKEGGGYMFIRQNNVKDEIGALSTSQGQDED